MKRTADSILTNLNPIKSAQRYETNWKQFLEHAKLQDQKPEESHFIEYFDYLKNTKGLASSSLWAMYSMLNNKHQLTYGTKLQALYPRLTLLLKRYEAGYVRKTAGVLTKEQIIEFLQNAPNEKEFVHIKAAVVVGFCGGLRCADLVSINSHDCEFNETTGLWITYSVSKQRGEQFNSKFNIPLEFCQYVETYDKALDESQASEGRMFKTFRVRKNGTCYYTKQPMGVHLLRGMTVKVATYLKLPNPERYTGHTLRRSSANALADAGVSTTQLKKHFNWRSEATALKYVENTDSTRLAISDKMRPSTSSSSKLITSEAAPTSKVLNLSNCQNIIIHF